MQFENGAGMMDKVFDFDGLKVYVDATSVMYLNGCIVDYVESLEGAGFKFENPNVKSTCGCGSLNFTYKRAAYRRTPRDANLQRPTQDIEHQAPPILAGLLFGHEI